MVIPGPAIRLSSENMKVMQNFWLQSRPIKLESILQQIQTLDDLDVH